MQSIAEKHGQIICAHCSGTLKSHPLQRGQWYHADGTEGADCADARGDRRIIPLQVEVPFRP